MHGLQSRISVKSAISARLIVARRRIRLALFLSLAWLAVSGQLGTPFASLASAEQAHGIVYFSLADFCSAPSYKDFVGMEIAQLSGGGVVPAQDKGTQVTFEEERSGLAGLLGGLDRTKRTGIFRFKLPAGNYVIHSLQCNMRDQSTTFGMISTEKRSFWDELAKGPAPVDPRAGVGYFTVLANEVANGGSLTAAKENSSSVLKVRPLDALEISYVKQVYPADAAKLVYRPATRLPLSRPSEAGAKAPPTEAAAAWNAVKDTKELSQLETFRKRYGRANPLYDDLAKKRIAALKAASPGLVSKTPFDNIAASPRALIAGRGVGSVLMGMTQAQVAAVLGEASEINTFSNGSLYMNYYEKGLSIVFENGKADGIFAYTGRADHYGESKFRKYNGVLPAGLSMDSSIAQVTAKLGEPADSGTFENDRWLRYDEGMSFDFNQAGLITHILVQAPR